MMVVLNVRPAGITMIIVAGAAGAGGFNQRITASIGLELVIVIEENNTAKWDSGYVLSLLQSCTICPYVVLSP